MNKTNQNRRLTFYKHLTSYVLANEVDKFVSSRFGKFDQADVQLVIATGEAFQQFDCDMPQIEREKLYLALILSYVSKYFHTHDLNHFSTFVRALYAQNSSRIVEKQLLDRFRAICLKKIAWLIETELFQDDERRQRIIELIGDDVDEMDEFRNEEQEYTNENMYDEICDLIRGEERFKEQSLFYEVSENVFEPCLSFQQQTLLINQMNSMRNKRKLESSSSVENSMVTEKTTVGGEKISLTATTDNNKKPRLSGQKESKDSKKTSVGSDSDKENVSLRAQDKSASTKDQATTNIKEKASNTENMNVPNNNNIRNEEIDELADLDLIPSQQVEPDSNNQPVEPTTSTVAAVTTSTVEEGPKSPEKKEKSFDKSRMIKLKKSDTLNFLDKSESESENGLDFGETTSDKEKREKEKLEKELEKEKRVNALLNKKPDSEKTKEKNDKNSSSEDEDDANEKKPRTPIAVRPRNKTKGLYSYVSGSDDDSEDELDLSNLRKVNLKKTKQEDKSSSSTKEKEDRTTTTKTSETPARKSITTKKEKTSDSDVDVSSDSEAELSSKKKSINKSTRKSSIGKVGKKRRNWTDEETIYLFVGINLYGVGRWSEILKRFADKFNNRMGPDLKDRYRNVKDGPYLARFEEEANRMIKVRNIPK